MFSLLKYHIPFWVLFIFQNEVFHFWNSSIFHLFMKVIQHIFQYKLIHFRMCFYKPMLCLRTLFSPISLKIDCFTYLSNQCIYNMPPSIACRRIYRLPINTRPKKTVLFDEEICQIFSMYFSWNATFNLSKMPIFFLYDWFISSASVNWQL